MASTSRQHGDSAGPTQEPRHVKQLYFFEMGMMVQRSKLLTTRPSFKTVGCEGHVLGQDVVPLFLGVIVL